MYGREIYGVAPTMPGYDPGIGNLNMGFQGEPTNGIQWDPSSTGSAAGSIRYGNYGIPPPVTQKTTLGPWESLTFGFMLPPLLDGQPQLLQPDMAVMAVRYNDVREENTTVVLSICKWNELSKDQWRTHKQYAQESRGMGDNSDEHVRWDDLMLKYGETGLSAYGRFLRNREDWPMIRDIPADIVEFYNLSQKSEFSFMSLEGIESRYNYLGVCANMGRAFTLEGEDAAEYTLGYDHAAITIGKRTRVAQMFGRAEDIQAGSKVWLKCRRVLEKQKEYGPYLIIPGGSRKSDYCPLSERAFYDESGGICFGKVWKMGVVQYPSNKDPTPAAIQQATGCSLASVTERNAYDCHAALPVIYIAQGFKH